MGKAVISMHNYFKVSKVIQFQRPECHWFTPAEDMARRTDKKWLCLLITETANVFQLVLTGFMSLENYRSASSCRSDTNMLVQIFWLNVQKREGAFCVVTVLVNIKPCLTHWSDFSLTWASSLQSEMSSSQIEAAWKADFFGEPSWHSMVMHLGCFWCCYNFRWSLRKKQLVSTESFHTWCLLWFISSKSWTRVGSALNSMGSDSF